MTASPAASLASRNALMVPMARIERATSPLPRECSATELHGPKSTTNRAAASMANNSGAGEGNRTLVVSLEGFCSTIELHPRAPFTNLQLWWRRLDSNQRRRKPTDLQSAPFSHSGTPPTETADCRGKRPLLSNNGPAWNCETAIDSLLPANFRELVSNRHHKLNLHRYPSG